MIVSSLGCSLAAMEGSVLRRRSFDLVVFLSMVACVGGAEHEVCQEAKKSYRWKSKYKIKGVKGIEWTETRQRKEEGNKEPLGKKKGGNSRCESVIRKRVVGNERGHKRTWYTERGRSKW